MLLEQGPGELRGHLARAFLHLDPVIHSIISSKAHRHQFMASLTSFHLFSAIPANPRISSLPIVVPPCFSMLLILVSPSLQSTTIVIVSRHRLSSSRSGSRSNQCLPSAMPVPTSPKSFSSNTAAVHATGRPVTLSFFFSVREHTTVSRSGSHLATGRLVSLNAATTAAQAASNGFPSKDTKRRSMYSTQ
ncbi:hypothetical protein VTG60DRAFT_5743 [Thermothelomyces hinnuleus]